ncbi:angiopoietin-1 [Culex quinquefasciatus]|uniref:Angiopoietin-1 n=1 Tax=Culex quinquefasciatus TaxID=7176 RepID=B0WS96_CULQU|nr:angiopoietin-1 [Culex quinquefasciatus]|eukprot:XP_001851580.1 angiopoietin-1 [Culex quinquefasciatus]
MLSSRGFVLLLIGVVTFSSNAARYYSPCQGDSYSNTWPAPCIDGNHPFGDGWLLVQQRVDETGNFYRSWTDYKSKFGQGDNFWVGLDAIHRAVSSGTYELIVEMVGEYGEYRFARYTNFLIGNETESYALKELGQYSGTAGDGLVTHKGAVFSTYDRDRDQNANQNCAVGLKGGWWFARSCMDRSVQSCNLNGKLAEQGGTLYWRVRRGSESLKYVRMMIREAE